MFPLPSSESQLLCSTATVLVTIPNELSVLRTVRVTIREVEIDEVCMRQQGSTKCKQYYRVSAMKHSDFIV
jgi:hypothetical protein